jgi:intracellular sulfur oxidation DsrE/DsrF family protein
MTPVDVRADIQANLIPGATLIPAMVGEVTRLQQHGYTLVLVPHSGRRITE